MTRLKTLFVVALVLAFASLASAEGKLRVGDEAPEFPSPLPSSAGEKPGEVKLSLKDVLGKKNVVLAFYVADWTGG
jgi:peroxiredoxin